MARLEAGIHSDANESNGYLPRLEAGIHSGANESNRYLPRLEAGIHSGASESSNLNDMAATDRHAWQQQRSRQGDDDDAKPHHLALLREIILDNCLHQDRRSANKRQVLSIEK